MSPFDLQICEQKRTSFERSSHKLFKMPTFIKIDLAKCYSISKFFVTFWGNPNRRRNFAKSKKKFYEISICFFQEKKSGKYVVHEILDLFNFNIKIIFRPESRFSIFKEKRLVPKFLPHGLIFFPKIPE